MVFSSVLRVLLFLVVCEGIQALAPRAAHSMPLTISHLSSSSPTTKSPSSSSHSSLTQTSGSSLSSVISTVTKIASKISTTSNSVPGTITAAPTLSTSAYAWGNQSIILNTCSFVAPGGNIEYEPCSVQVGSIKLSYFPEPSGNISYPKTHYVPEWDIIMYAPSHIFQIFVMKLTSVGHHLQSTCS